jgi:hypothetical protein
MSVRLAQAEEAARAAADDAAAAARKLTAAEAAGRGTQREVERLKKEVSGEGMSWAGWPPGLALEPFAGGGGGAGSQSGCGAPLSADLTQPLRHFDIGVGAVEGLGAQFPEGLAHGRARA